MSKRILSPTGITGAAAGTFKTVNIVSSMTGFLPGQIKTEIQLQAGQGGSVIAGPTGTKGLPTIFVPGYTGPA